MKNQSNVLFNFKNLEDQVSWRVVNDGVMGGISDSKAYYRENNQDPGLTFQGVISLENNGGFASIRAVVDSIDFTPYSGMQLQVRGDGKNYQLRLRTDNRFDGISYRHQFQTISNKTQVITFNFDDFEPVFRGRIVPDIPPLEPAQIKQLGFLIADKQAGDFKLEIDWIKGIK